MTSMQMAMVGAASAGVADVITLNDQNSAAQDDTSASVVATYALNNDGTTISSSESPVNWINNAGNVALYECRLTIVTGTTPTGTMATWLTLASSQSWSITRSTLGITAGVCTIEIRNASTLVVLDTATISFSAEVFERP